MGESTIIKNGKRKKKRLRRIILIAVVLVVFAGAGFFTMRRFGGTGTTQYVSYTASVGTISNAMSFSGSLKLVNSAEYTADSAASVRAVYAQEGAAVHKGDLLLRLTSGQTVKAEFDGKVNQLHVQAGDAVSAGAALVQVADFTRLKIAVNVDEYDIGNVSVGQQCTVTMTATEKVYQSQIASINYISSSSGTVAYYTATAYVDVEGGIYPGMQVTMTIPMEEARDVVVLKMDALGFTPMNEAYVFVRDAQGEMQMSPVTTGVSNGNYVEIKSGLASGDVVYAVGKETASSLFSLLPGVGGMERRIERQQEGGQSQPQGQPGTQVQTRPSFEGAPNPGGGN